MCIRDRDLLVQDGYVERKQGSGYRVLTISPASDTCLTSFTDAMLRSGLEPKSRLISIEQIDPRKTDKYQLPESLMGQSLTCIRRLRLVDDEPRMLVETYAPSKLLTDASARDFPESGSEQSMLRILGNRFELDWCAACEDISPIAATQSMADALQVPVGQPLLRQSCSAFDTEGEVAFHEDVFRTGSVRFNLTPQSRTSIHE